MKKTKINLLINKQDYQKVEKYFYFLRYITIFFIIVFALSLGYVFIQLRNQDNKINTLSSKKKSLLESLKNKEEDEANIIFINNKYNTLKKFEEDDVKALPYYNLLITALSQNSTDEDTKTTEQIEKDVLGILENEGTESADIAEDNSKLATKSAIIKKVTEFELGSLEIFKLDKERNVEFTVTFNNLTRFIDFISFIESNKFLKYFEHLSINGFSLTHSTKSKSLGIEKENYKLSLKGKFIKINEEEIN